MTTVRKAVLALAAAAALATWAAASAYLAGGPVDLVPFVVPGAIFGVWLGWLAHAFARPLYSWRRGLVAAVAGGLLLPPWLAALIVIAADYGSAQLVTVLAAGALLSLVAGLLLAIGFAVPEVRRRRRHRRAQRQAEREPGAATEPHHHAHHGRAAEPRDHRAVNHP